MARSTSDEDQIFWWIDDHINIKTNEQQMIRWTNIGRWTDAHADADAYACANADADIDADLHISIWTNADADADA